MLFRSEASIEGDTQKINEITKEISEIKQLVSQHQELFKHKPDFLGGDLDTQEDARLFYRAMVRKLLDGNIGKTERILHAVMRGEITTMDELANALNPESAPNMDQQLERNWLESRLNIVRYGKETPGVIFNACLLPDSDKLLKSERLFNPMIFSKGRKGYQIDHLIPNNGDHTIQDFEGYEEIDSLANLAPLEKIGRAHV